MNLCFNLLFKKKIASLWFFTLSISQNYHFLLIYVALRRLSKTKLWNVWISLNTKIFWCFALSLSLFIYIYIYFQLLYLRIKFCIYDTIYLISTPIAHFCMRFAHLRLLFSLVDMLRVYQQWFIRMTLFHLLNDTNILLIDIITWIINTAILGSL